MRWRLKLEEYDYIIHKAGKGNANALNRNPIRNDEHVHNVQAKKREDDTKKDKEGKGIYGRRETTNIIWISCTEYHDDSCREALRGIMNDKKNKIAYMTDGITKETILVQIL